MWFSPLRDRRQVTNFFLGLIAFPLLVGCGGADGLVIQDGVLKTPVPGQDKSVGYMTLINPTADVIEITAVQVAGVRAVEMHETTGTEVRRMRRLNSVVIPAGEQVMFVTGGKHLMLFGVGDLQQDQAVAVTFTDSKQQQVTQQFRVIGFDQTP